MIFHGGSLRQNEFGLKVYFTRTQISQSLVLIARVSGEMWDSLKDDSKISKMIFWWLAMILQNVLRMICLLIKRKTNFKAAGTSGKSEILNFKTGEMKTDDNNYQRGLIYR